MAEKTITLTESELANLVIKMIKEEKASVKDKKGLEAKDMKKKIETGAKVEAEHKSTIKFIADYLKKMDKLPSNEEIYKSIAKDHIEEFDKYYEHLEDMEDELKKEK